MPLLDIATPQSLFRNNNLYSIGFQTIHHHVSFISGNNPKTARLTYFHNPVKLRGRFMIRAVATLEPVCSDKENGNVQQLPVHSAVNLTSAGEQTGVQDEKEVLRRNRISKANKGREAWNKGIKHSAETRQKIRERTKLAMRSPEVKMKLIKGIHNQSQETRLKIAAAVRLTWDKRRSNRRMMLRCHREWLNLIAEASRKGFSGEEELQWDSYKIISKQCEMEFQEGMKARKENRGTTPGIRAPKSLEQRKKISEAIAAKWADPSYRDRVYSGIAKRRGTDPVARNPEWGTKKKEPKKPVKKREKLYDSTKIKEHRPKLRTAGNPVHKEQRPKLRTAGNPVHKEQRQARFKDPQARYKLEMIKSIRAQRAVTDPKISEAILRANVLISEAQRAAEALEEAAAKSPMAEASLIETRKLIAEAISYIKSIEMGSSGSPGDGFVKEEIVEGLKEEKEEREVNGVRSLELNDAEITKFSEVVGVKVNGRPSSWSESSLKVKEVEADDVAPGKQESEGEGKGKGKGRRWVCGRLVDDEDENEGEQ